MVGEYEIPVLLGGNVDDNRDTDSMNSDEVQGNPDSTSSDQVTSLLCSLNDKFDLCDRYHLKTPESW